VAVAGTHGKTTTTVMVTEALTAPGEILRDSPAAVSLHGAATPASARCVVRRGGRRVRQAFLSLQPTIAVVNNVEADHLECYGSVEALEKRSPNSPGARGG